MVGAPGPPVGEFVELVGELALLADGHVAAGPQFLQQGVHGGVGQTADRGGHVGGQDAQVLADRQFDAALQLVDGVAQGVGVAGLAQAGGPGPDASA
ncbi:hypothetical protein [Nocardiopsis sp. CNR-923]|uniref:hypothetical protein n=1 Tax=Nocardiopsis sp. CNR-923 TaxID=1904965 RepID=UPI00373FCBDC